MPGDAESPRLGVVILSCAGPNRQPRNSFPMVLDIPHPVHRIRLEKHQLQSLSDHIGSGSFTDVLITALWSENVQASGIRGSNTDEDELSCRCGCCSCWICSHGTSVYAVGPAFASGSPPGPNILTLASESFSAHIHLLRRFAGRHCQDIMVDMKRGMNTHFRAPSCQLLLYLMSTFNVIFVCSGISGRFAMNKRSLRLYGLNVPTTRTSNTGWKSRLSDCKKAIISSRSLSICSKLVEYA